MQPSYDPLSSLRLAVVGDGRLGRAMAVALRDAGADVGGPFGRGYDGAGTGAVILCVPDAQIGPAAGSIVPGPLVGHCSGATGLDALGDRPGFSLHPLMTFTEAGGRFEGAGAAIAANTPAALDLARRLAQCLSMEPVEVGDDDRAAYHAAASIASNFLITLEAAAERLAAAAGVDRRLLAPLVRATVENWSVLGAERALTGPVARGDRDTVARQREAVARRMPDFIPVFDALVDATRAVAVAA